MSSNVRRLLAGLIAAAAIVSALAGCADAGTKKESGNESEAEKSAPAYEDTADTEIETLKTIDPPVAPGDSDAVLFVISCTNDGPYDWGSDYIESITYTVCCNGSLEIAEQYSQTGEKTTYKQLTDEDFTDISLDMTYAYNKQPWSDKDYSDYMDGYTWGFKYYNAHGKETYIYGGYTDGCDELEEIEDILQCYNGQL